MGVLGKLGFRRAGGDAEGLYGKIVAQARADAFYVDGGVPDTPAGRFDMVALHAWVVMRRLKEHGRAGADLAQRVFDVMFADMDVNLREMGVGDLGVGRRVKDLAKSFYGRIKAYDEGLAGGSEALAEALRRNLFAERTPDDTRLARMVAYLQGAVAASRAWDLEALAGARIDFPPPPRADGGA